MKNKWTEIEHYKIDLSKVSFIGMCQVEKNIGRNSVSSCGFRIIVDGVAVDLKFERPSKWSFDEAWEKAKEHRDFFVKKHQSYID